MKKKFFTLVELLVVIGIIVLLAGMLLPVVNGAIKKAEMTKAKAEITNLVNAIKQYESTYGVLPIQKNASGDFFKIDTDANYEWLIKILQGENVTDSDRGNSAVYNKRSIKFLDIQGNEPGEYKDPWDNNFVVYLDKSYTGKMEMESTHPIPGLNPKVVSGKYYYYYSVIVYSKGPDGKDEKDPRNDSSNKDNIYSMNTTWDKSDGHVIGK